jgi:methionyl-tRNA formyltransferase
MRIVFVGAVEFSQYAIECLLSMNADVVGICTLKESQLNADHVDLSNIGASHGIPCLYANDINSEESLEWIKDKAPDVIFCFGWSKLLKQEILALPPLGVVGFHPAALPANRGRHPLIWALVLGLKNTASTFFFMDVGADSGDILSQRNILIDDHDDARMLYSKITKEALLQIQEFVPLLEARSFPRVPQDFLLSNTWRKRGAADGQIDWRMSATSIHNLVRGLSKPYIGAHFVFEGQEIKVWKTELILDVASNIEPGKVLRLENSNPVVMCGDNAVCLLLTEPKFEPKVGIYL